MRSILRKTAKIILTLSISSILITAYDVYKSSNNINSDDNINNVAEASFMRAENTNASNELTNQITPDAIKRIICWGDSITFGLGAGEGTVNIDGTNTDISNWSYPDTLANFTGLEVYNLGVCSESSYEIALRQGGLKMYIEKAVTVKPGKTSKINIVDSSGNKIELQNFNGYASYNDEPENLIYIDGIPYQLTSKNGNYYIAFYDKNASENVKIKKNSQVVTKAAYDIANTASDVLIIQMGSNGGWDDYNTLISQYKAMIDKSGTQCYIIIGDTDNPKESIDSESYTDNYEPGLNDTYWEAALREAFGEHFINMRTYMLENALDVAGLEATEKDTYNLSNGLVPESIKFDYTHMNSYGYYVMGKAVYDKGIELGYWQ